MKKNSFLSFLVCFSYYSAFAQNLNSSKVFVYSCFNKHQCFSYSDNGGSFIFYNPENNEFSLVIDFKKFLINNDSLDSWLDDLDDSKLVFSGVLSPETLPSISNHNSKVITINGKISFNNVTSSHSIELSLFEISDQGVLFQNTSQNYFDRVRANMQFNFYPKEFMIHKKQHHLRKTISVAIYSGFINRLRPELEFMLKSSN